MNTDDVTDSFKRVAALAMADAVRLGHPGVGTEHLLAAMMGDSTNAAKDALVRCGATGALVLHQLLILQIPCAKRTPPLPLMPRAEEVVARAIYEAALLRHPRVGPEHLLLAMIAVPECAAAQMLTNIGIDHAKLRATVLEPLGL